jgi:RNA polymerase sigma-32 factor
MAKAARDQKRRGVDSNDSAQRDQDPEQDRDDADRRDDDDEAQGLVEVVDPELLPAPGRGPHDEDDDQEDEDDKPAVPVRARARERALDHGPVEPLRSPIQRFISEARRFPRLDDEEERRLIKDVREHDDQRAARTLVVHNLRLVISIAYQYRQAWTNMLDLFQEGSVGLLEAVKHWDPTLGTRFGSYAAYWIRAYILRFLMTNARLIHVGNTRAGRKLFFRLERERQKLLAAGFDATPKLLAAKLDVDVKDVEEVSAHLASREVSLDPRPDDEGIALEERLPGLGASPETQAARSELSGAVAQLMRRFAASLTDPRERAIWHDHLAAAEEPTPLGVLGERFGVSKQRMGQIADKLKKRFREQILSELGSDIQLQWQSQQE